MLRTIYLLLIILVLLPGCQREQKGLHTVYNKETIADFTTIPPSQLPPKKPAQHLPGKAVIPGAPIEGFQTKTGRASAQPSAITPRGPSHPVTPASPS